MFRSRLNIDTRQYRHTYRLPPTHRSAWTNVESKRDICQVGLSCCVRVILTVSSLSQKQKQNKTKRSKKKKKRADERRQNISCCNLGLFLERLCWYVFLILKFKKGFRFQPVAIIILFYFFFTLRCFSRLDNKIQGFHFFTTPEKIFRNSNLRDIPVPLWFSVIAKSTIEIGRLQSH